MQHERRNRHCRSILSVVPTRFLCNQHCIFPSFVLGLSRLTQSALAGEAIAAAISRSGRPIQHQSASSCPKHRRVCLRLLAQKRCVSAQSYLLPADGSSDSCTVFADACALCPEEICIAHAVTEYTAHLTTSAVRVFGHFHKSCKNRVSGEHCAGKSLCGQGNSPAKILRP